MEPTVCPWCQSEIVWDEEIGPEEHCPHCANELKGYRTLNIALEDEDAEEDAEVYDVDYEEASDEEAEDLRRIWGAEPESMSTLRAVDKYGEDHDLFAFEETVEGILDEQEEVPECLHCREYMLFAGTQRVSGEGFQPVNFPLIQGPVLQTPYEMNVYVCPGCFQVQYNLAENDRLQMIKSFIHKKE